MKVAWTEQTDEFVRRFYPDHSCKWLAAALSTSPEAVRRHAAVLGVNKKAPNVDRGETPLFVKRGGVLYSLVPWTPDFKPEKKPSMRGKVNPRIWTDEQIAALKQNWGKVPADEIAKKVGRSVYAVENKASGLCLGAGFRRKVPAARHFFVTWTDDEKDCLKENWSRLSLDRISDLTGHSLHQCYAMAEELDLGKKPKVRPLGVHWTPEQDALLRRNWGLQSLAVLAESLHRSTAGVRRRAEALGLAPKPKVKNPKTEEMDNLFQRRCHDCGRPTTQYRCPECTRKWRLKNGVENIDSGYGGL